jgi:hypothetical protein
MTEAETPEYLTLREYADAIGKSPRTVQRQLATGEITSDKKLPGTTGDHLFRADREDVQRGGVA